MTPIIFPSVSTSFGYTHKEMIDLVASELGNVNIQLNITSWLNLAITDLASKHVIGHLHRYDTKSSVAGNPDVKLADDFYWLKTVAIPAQSKKLYPIDEQRISEISPQYRSIQGAVSWYYLNGNTLGLWLVPSSVFAIEYSYQRRPVKLVELTDICDLPPEWHSLVVQKAITKGYSQEGNDSGFAISLQMERSISRDIQLAMYRRLDETFVLDSPRHGNRLPRPSLPGSFPRTGG